jgi:hypothetical protein
MAAGFVDGAAPAFVTKPYPHAPTDPAAPPPHHGYGAASGSALDPSLLVSPQPGPSALPAAIGGGLPKWVGELYFERHRGTYTTQAATKRSNRLCQTALHDAEMLAVGECAAQ